MIEKPKMMKCGHSANAESHGKPVCLICMCDEVDEELSNINLDDREAKCCECGKTTKSSVFLPFFQYLPKSKKDEYYCGCRGWD